MRYSCPSLLQAEGVVCRPFLSTALPSPSFQCRLASNRSCYTLRSTQQTSQTRKEKKKMIEMKEKMKKMENQKSMDHTTKKQNTKKNRTHPFSRLPRAIRGSRPGSNSLEVCTCCSSRCSSCPDSVRKSSAIQSAADRVVTRRRPRSHLS